MWDEEGWKWNPVPYSYRKAPTRPSGYMFPSDERIATYSTFAFTSYALQKDWTINPSISATETSNKFYPTIPPNSSRRGKLKIPILSGIVLGAWFCLCTTAVELEGYEKLKPRAASPKLSYHTLT